MGNFNSIFTTTLAITLLVMCLMAYLVPADESELAVEWRFRDRRNADQFDGPIDEDTSGRNERRRIFDPDRPRRFDGSFFQKVGWGLILTAVGVLVLALVSKYVLEMFKVI